MSNGFPKVSIGIPVYNGEKYIKQSLQSLISQTFYDCEFIISDNASTDNTESICREFIAKDKRIRYFRQTENIGAWRNFRFVLDQAKSDFFMWSAAHDTRSLDFVQLNYEFLKANPEFVSSTCPNTFEDKMVENNNLIDFKLDNDDIYTRYKFFFDNCWNSHGIFYSLIRRDILKDCEILNNALFFVGADWGVNLFIAKKGKIHRTKTGLTIFGVSGDSRKINFYKNSRIANFKYIEFIVPFFHLSLYVLHLSKNLSKINRMKIFLILIRLNIKVNYDRFKTFVKLKIT